MNWDNIYKFVRWPLLLIVAVYIGSMFIAPWFQCDREWNCVLDVWDRWQGLNVGMLAFISSVVAFSIARFNADKQRQREFQASKAFMPDALSELSGYFKECADVYIALWRASENSPAVPNVPEYPEKIASIFENLIRHAEPSVGEYLASILADIQVHRARLSTSHEDILDSQGTNPNHYSLLTYFFWLGKLQARVNRLFPFARNLEDFDSSALQFEELQTAYVNLGVISDLYRINDDMDLVVLTERRLQNETDQGPDN